MDAGVGRHLRVEGGGEDPALPDEDRQSPVGEEDLDARAGAHERRGPNEHEGERRPSAGEGDGSLEGIDLATLSYFIGSERIEVTPRPGMAMWREHLYAFMSRNATGTIDLFGLPIDQTLQIGVGVEL